jgi:hypothetical protein
MDLRSFTASGPGIRVIELNILGIQIQLLSINMGRRRTLFGSPWGPATVAHFRVDRTITVGRRHFLVNRCGSGFFDAGRRDRCRTERKPHDE